MRELQPPYEEIWQSLCKGEVVPFIGAACSLAHRPAGDWDDQHPAGLPSGAELSRYLARVVNFPEEQGRDDLGKVADYFSLSVGRPRLLRRLRAVFEHDFPYGPIHDLLASIPTPQLFVTTNYDTMIERALRAHGKAFDVVVHATETEWAASVLHWPAGESQPRFVSPKRLQIDLEHTTVVYKMHGAVDPADAERDAYVIGEREYVQFMVRMATQTAVPAIFAEPFMTRSFLFLGYGLRDWNLRVLLSKIATDLRRSRLDPQPSWAIQRRPTPLERELWARQNVNLYAVDLNEFVERIRTVSQS